jgi:signal transduction histidine kinase
MARTGHGRNGVPDLTLVSVPRRHRAATVPVRWRSAPGASARWSGLVGASRRTMTWALGGYLATVAVGVGIVGRSVADLAAGIAFGLAFLLAAGVVVVTFWRFSERAYAQQERYRRQLFDAEMGALARLREAGQIREDVIASVSHEFRTPLTAIRGSAATLLAREDQLRPEDRTVLLRGVVEHSDRLGRLLEDMLLAASATGASDRGAVADVTAALSSFALDSSRPPVTVDVEPGLAAYVDAVALDQVVVALADHVRAEARRDRPVTVCGRQLAGEVVVDVAYEPVAGGDGELRRLFEPFGSPESARTGRPASLALYVVRRLVESHGGRVAAGRERDRTRVRVALRALRPREGAGLAPDGGVAPDGGAAPAREGAPVPPESGAEAAGEETELPAATG